MTASERIDATLAHFAAIADDLQIACKSRGGDVVEVVLREGSELSTSVRLGEVEQVEQAGHRSAGLRLMKWQPTKQAFSVAHTSSSDFSKSGLQRLVDDAFELAALSEPDPFAGPPEVAPTNETPLDLQLFDNACAELSAEQALDRARRGERAAMDFDARITNSEGASFSRSDSASLLSLNSGFVGTQRGSYAALSVAPLATEPGSDKKWRGSHWTARRWLSELETPEFVGKKAAERAIARLGARSVESCLAPVIFDPEAGRSIVGLLAGCISGGAIYRRSSYLVDRLGTSVASPLVTILDDSTLVRGPGSRLFDGEGFASRRLAVVERGVLQAYLLDSYCGRKLKLQSNASAGRGGNGAVSVSTSNFVLQPGSTAPADIVAGTSSGLLVTDLMGFGFNPVTGDFSRGASGFWVENGAIAFAVNEVTISLNLHDLLSNIDLVGSELDMRSSVCCPMFRVSSMTIAGSQ